MGDKGAAAELGQPEAVVEALLRRDCILLVGAGFSRSVPNEAGGKMPGVAEISAMLWEIAYPGEPFEAGTQFGDVLRAATKRNAQGTKDLLELQFRTDRSQLPRSIAGWFYLPWHRIYTLNYDDVGEAAFEAPEMPRDWDVVSAVSTDPPWQTKPGAAELVHLHGYLYDFPNLTADFESYANRTSGPDVWYENFTADIVAHPTVFVGTTLNEFAMWHYLRARGGARRKDLRPQSWLISPGLERARRDALAEFNIRWIEGTATEFFESNFEPRLSDLTDRSRALGEAARRARGSCLVDVADALRAAGAGSPDLFQGVDSEWADLGESGFAAEFSWYSRLEQHADGSAGLLTVVHGEPGCGKTLALRWLASRCSRRGSAVKWLDVASDPDLVEALREIQDVRPDYLVVDALEYLGRHGPVFLRSALAAVPNMRVVVSIRTSRMNRAEYRGVFEPASFFEVPRLVREDALALTLEMARANRLGELRRLSEDQRVQRFLDGADRQLLVALIELTSGVTLDEKLAAECADLGPTELVLYGLMCLAHFLSGSGLTEDELLIASGFTSNDGLLALQALTNNPTENAELSVAVRRDGWFGARHRVIAERVVRHFGAEGHLMPVYAQLVGLVARKYSVEAPQRDRYGRLMIVLLNHDLLRDRLGAAQTRALYHHVEGILRDEFHYWLQLGQFELDCLDFPAARTALSEARGIRPNDIMVLTAWGQMELREALAEGFSTASREKAERGLDQLEALLVGRPVHSPHTYEVFVSRGLDWMDLLISNGQLSAAWALALRIDIQAEAALRLFSFERGTLVVRAASEARRRVAKVRLGRRP